MIALVFACMGRCGLDEYVDHLFFHCEWFGQIWILINFKLVWCFQCSFYFWFWSCYSVYFTSLVVCSKRYNQSSVHLIWLPCVWSFWKEKNICIFCVIWRFGFIRCLRWACWCFYGLEVSFVIYHLIFTFCGEISWFVLECSLSASVVSFSRFGFVVHLFDFSSLLFYAHLVAGWSSFSFILFWLLQKQSVVFIFFCWFFNTNNIFFKNIEKYTLLYFSHQQEYWLNYIFGPLSFPKLWFWPPKKTTLSRPLSLLSVAILAL